SLSLSSSPSTLPPHPTLPLFPYTTLFRSSPTLSLRTESHVLQEQNGIDGKGVIQLDDIDVRSLYSRLRKRPLRSPRDTGHCQIRDRKSTRLNSSHQIISYAVSCLTTKTHN